MRLPTLTEAQKRNEDSREIHERLWALVQTGGRLRLPATEESIATREIWRQHGTLHRFWACRGYILKTKVTKDRTALEMWLVPRVERKAAA
jgi:hypothetical protein